MGSPFLGDIGDAAVTQFGVDPSVISDFVAPTRVPFTRTRTSHGFSMRWNGRIIGAVHLYGERQQRQVDEEWECNRDTDGSAPADVVPQRLTGRSIQVARYDLYVANIEDIAMTTGEMVVLTDQFRPLELRTDWQSGLGIGLGGRRIQVYSGCWFTDLGREIRSDDNRIVSANATIMWTSKDRVL